MGAKATKTIAKQENSSKDEPSLPYRYREIMMNTTSQWKTQVDPEIHTKGVFLVPENTTIYWVDAISSMNCFEVYANGLQIVWGDDSRYWKESKEEDPKSKKIISVFVLQNVCWLEITGKFKVENLNPEATYEVQFEVKLEQDIYGWEIPVLLNLKYEYKDESRGDYDQKIEKNLKKQMEEEKTGEWMKLTVGEFKPDEVREEIMFTLMEIKGGNWKKGLVVKSVTIKPKSL